MTLAQQFVERARADELGAALDKVLWHEAALSLRIIETAVDYGTAFLILDSAPDLQRVHETVMDTLAPFESPDATARAFRANGETIRPQDVEWVASYREQSAYGRFRPHVTLGHGARLPLRAPIDFRADRVALCHLGRFCTCRTVFREWRLRNG